MNMFLELDVNPLEIVTKETIKENGKINKGFKKKGKKFLFHRLVIWIRSR
jgi:hypothetical protein